MLGTLITDDEIDDFQENNLGISDENKGFKGYSMVKEIENEFQNIWFKRLQSNNVNIINKISENAKKFYEKNKSIINDLKTSSRNVGAYLSIHNEFNDFIMEEILEDYKYYFGSISAENNNIKYNNAFCDMIYNIRMLFLIMYIIKL